MVLLFVALLNGFTFTDTLLIFFAQHVSHTPMQTSRHPGFCVGVRLLAILRDVWVSGNLGLRLRVVEFARHASQKSELYRGQTPEAQGQAAQRHSVHKARKFSASAKAKGCSPYLKPNAFAFHAGAYASCFLVRGCWFV